MAEKNALKTPLKPFTCYFKWQKARILSPCCTLLHVRYMVKRSQAI